MSTPTTDTTTTTATIPVETFRSALIASLDEAFVGAPAGQNIFTDEGTSIFATLAKVDAATASKVFSERAANIAAQVNHIRFYFDTLMDGLKNGWGKADWAGSWQIGEVSEAEWEDLVVRLRASYEEIRAFASTHDAWDANFVGGAFGILTHTAYHLGEIRSSLAALHAPE